MNEIEISAQQKHDNYSEQFKRLNHALSSGFNLEAIFIEYAIMEDRTESVLRHAGYWDSYIKSVRSNSTPGINSKISYISKRAVSNRKDLLNKYFGDDLLQKILVWKDKRNRLIHALLKQELLHNEIKELAEEGNMLAKTLRTRTTSYNRALDRAKVKQG